MTGADRCTFFEWAEFDNDGKPIWKNETAARRDVAGAESAEGGSHPPACEG